MRWTARRIFLQKQCPMKQHIRSWIRKRTMQKGTLISNAKDEKQESVYEMYYEFEEATQQAGRTPHPCTEPWREREVPDRKSRSTAG